MNFLLDTNIISEKIKPNRNDGVRKWMDSVELDTLYISVLTLGEIRQGIELMPHGNRKTRHMEWLLNDMMEQFEGRILDVDLDITQQWGILAAQYPQLAAIDGLLAATAIINDFALVSADKDFISLKEIHLINPWQKI